jgi:hypothetical protein
VNDAGRATPFGSRERITIHFAEMDRHQGPSAFLWRHPCAPSSCEQDFSGNSGKACYFPRVTIKKRNIAMMFARPRADNLRA